MTGFPTTPAETAQLAADVKACEEPFVGGLLDELGRVLRTRYPQIRSAALMSGDGTCRLSIAIDCRFDGRTRRTVLRHSIETPRLMPEETTIQIKPCPTNG